MLQKSHGFITKRSDGYYSTVKLSNGVIETCWFPYDESEPSAIIGRTYPATMVSVAGRHIAEHEAKQ